jgi:hypothetical protein
MARRTKEEAAAFREAERARVAANKAARAQKKIDDAARKEAARMARAYAKLEAAARDLAVRLQRAQEREAKKADMIKWRTFAIEAIIKAAVNAQHTLGEIDARGLHTLARDIGTCIQDLPVIPSGLISKKALAMVKESKRYKPTQEHYNPNQVMGHRILDYYLKHGYPDRPLFDFDPKLVELLTEARRTHEVTAEENRQLVKYQRNHVFTTPEQSYLMAGIDLIEKNIS